MRVGRFSGANHQSVSRSNRSVIFRALHAMAPISRVELAQETGLNAATITNIVDELIRSGLVRETTQSRIADSPRVGRRRIQLEVVADARYAIGIDLARNGVSGAVVNLAGKIVASYAEPAVELVGSKLTEQLARTVDGLHEQISSEQRSRVVGYGVGAPGALSVRTGRFQPPPSFGDGEGIDLRSELQRAVQHDIIVDNNGNTATLAELWFGAGVNVSNFVLLNLGTGVGAGLVLDGELYRGEHDLAAEIGHVSIAMDGRSCSCGNYGCLELYVSVPRVLAAAAAAVQTGEPSVLRNQELTLDAFLAAVNQDDTLATRVMDDTARYLSAGIVNIINMLDPDLVLIGRELARAGDKLLNPVRHEVRSRVMPMLRSTVRIEASSLTNAPVVGAAVLAMERFFERPLEDRT